MSIIGESDMEIEEQIDYICMNPNCNKSTLRFIGMQDIPQHKPCKGWVVKIDQMQKFLGPASQCISEKKNNLFNLKGQPLKSLFKINKFFIPKKSLSAIRKNSESSKAFIEEKDPISLLKLNFNQIKVKIDNELQKIYNQVESRLLKVKEVQERTTNQVRRILTTIEENQAVSKEIAKSSILKEYKQFCDVTDSFTLIDEEKIKKQIFKIFQSIESIGDSFWKAQIECVKREKQLIEKAYKQIEKLQNDESVHPGIKLQSLQTMFEEKHVETFYSEDKSEIWAKCWICNNQLFGQGKNIKERKASAYENLVNHIKLWHSEETNAKIAVQMVKSSTHRLSWADFLKLLEEKYYKEFIIVDRQNMSHDLLSMINEKTNQKTLIINVVSIGRQNIALGKYLVAMSKGKDSADTLMIMAIYAIITSGYYRYVSSFNEVRKPKITLLTKDHFADTYQEILKNEFGVEINVIK